MAQSNNKIEYLSYQDLIHHLTENDDSHQKIAHRISRDFRPGDGNSELKAPPPQQ